MEPLKNKKSYAQPETVKHDSMNLVQGSKLYYTTLYYTYYYKLYYTTLYYYH
ncbi:MAG: hypothetical protein II605_02095 [Paludibacteraceae bacterium]|nr:hypothetical protein [Paludibacteraceae bacterium]MBQ2520792.1 hypothetical protein [Paludibacteraceae bacterium]MBQ4018016.1 hypothetical protein [Paludibacteraceae bacterium]MBQ5379256.1 hypothetical protein [Paludibacteraceae bacterium]